MKIANPSRELVSALAAVSWAGESAPLCARAEVEAIAQAAPDKARREMKDMSG
jgi:hypothetical protein